MCKICKRDELIWSRKFAKLLTVCFLFTAKSYDSYIYIIYIRWYHGLKTDPVHKKVMKTLRSFMEDDEMDYTEAVEAAISKRKYLLNSLFDLEHFPTEDPASTEDDDFTYEPMKRKY